MKLIVVGARGMLGRDMTDLARAAGHEVEAFGRDQVDVTKPSSVDHLPVRADWLINCAAFTNVDGAEADPSAAEATNATGVGTLANWCAKKNISLLHVSTDYVFDGVAKTPYRENASLNPLGVYARSKVHGEELVRAASDNHLIARTQGLFGRHGRNFVRTILDLLKKGGPLRIVNDQWTCPTYTHDLAQGILALLGCKHRGTVHVSSEGECSWYELGCFIRDASGLSNAIEPVDTAAFPRPARRPAYSVLDKSRLNEWTGQRLPDWRVAVTAYLQELRMHGE